MHPTIWLHMTFSISDLVTRLLLLVLFHLPQATFAQKQLPDPHYKLVTAGSYVQSKNYYLLTLFQQLPEVSTILKKDPVLKTFAANKLDSLQQALKNCEKNGACYTSYLKFSEAEIEQIAQRLKALYRPGNELGRLVKDHLIPSGAYILFQDLPAEEMLAKAWSQDAAGINYAISVYADGKKPNYPNIDSISINAGVLYNTASLIAAENAYQTSFFDIPLTAALTFIDLNERDQAADFEPMEKGENKPALDRISTIKWNTYKYSLILVPGAGPDDPATPLSGEGMLRCRLAALQYRKGWAPFILTSGGKVHPYKTRYCEATEMKKYLVDKLHIPANAILIDPHARHTTTNMRNAVRIIYRYGIPFDKAALTCTTRGQSAMIEKTLIDRCKRELNEAPYKIGNRLSATEMEFYPQLDALQINPLEPLDP
ncbi:YdcF family protein [Flavitalea sp. BT771]|uniref:YdcF family protein n=1 Tax=Flavitalea sp. BT771 TaxID=3063329 RepID=UPI0026E3E614|nr:YdcF family protein [Flavitalea sp. BT771]MDO6430427.1 YdcF family protein [Flavitalea sp. BT771]MDV6219433.1 YdcF family protein [Flavitalea sp. BT771]